MCTHAADSGATAGAAAQCGSARGLGVIAADATAAAADGSDSRQHPRPLLAIQRANGPDSELADDARRSALWVRHPAVCGARGQHQVGRPCRHCVESARRAPCALPPVHVGADEQWCGSRWLRRAAERCQGCGAFRNLYVVVEAATGRWMCNFCGHVQASDDLKGREAIEACREMRDAVVRREQHPSVFCLCPACVRRCAPVLGW